MSSRRSEIDRWLSTDISLGHGPTILSDIREHIASRVGSIRNSLARAEARQVFLENHRETADSIIYTSPPVNSAPHYIDKAIKHEKYKPAHMSFRSMERWNKARSKTNIKQQKLNANNGSFGLREEILFLNKEGEMEPFEKS